jgi:hypothetical protein
MPKIKKPHKHNFIDVGRKPYTDNFGKAMIMVLQRCSVCGKQRFKSEKPKLCPGQQNTSIISCSRVHRCGR